MSLDLVFLGPPGAGKGTQAKTCAERHRLFHVSTGDLFRQNLREETPVGLVARGFMDRGHLVPDEVVCAMVRGCLEAEETTEGFILDGFPRTISQAEVLEEDLEQLERPLTSVVSFEIDDGMLMERLTGRLTCKGCSAPFHKTFNPPREEGVCDDCGAELYTRDDDTEPAVAARLDEYHDKTAPLLGYYEKRGLLRSVDAAQPVDGVSGALERALEDR